MSLLKLPFFYNSPQIKSFIIHKILNLEYYSNFIFCEEFKSTTLKTTIKLLKKKQKNKKKFKLKLNIFLNEIFIDTNNFIEYFEDDFFHSKKTIANLGFNYKLKQKYFSNDKITKYDFIEKYFLFNSCKNYLNNFYKNLQTISLKTPYKILMPIKPKKSGYIIFSFGLIGSINKKSLKIITKKQLFYQELNFFFILPTLSFYFLNLKINLKQQNRYKPRLKKRLKFKFY